MGNHKFRLSDMMPNAWFYKLKDMSSQAKRRNSDRSCHIRTRKQSSPTSILHVHDEFRLSCHPRQESFYTYTKSPLTLAEHLSRGSPTRNTKAFDICLPPNPIRRSPKRPFSNRKSVCKPCLSPRFTRATYHACNSTTTLSSVWLNSDQDGLYYSVSSSPPDSRVSSDPFDEVVSWSSSFSPRISSFTDDIIIDISNKSSTFAMKRLKNFDSHMDLPPIFTKATNKYEKRDDLHQEIRKALHEHHRSLSAELSKQETNNRRRRRKRRLNANVDNSQVIEKEPSRKSSPKPSSGVKVRGRNSPRVLTISGMRRARRSVSSVSTSRSSISESYAVIKCSYDPEKDFKDSMMEMVVEHHIKASEELEDLLACYLTLNSDEYHDHIVEAFEQIWRDVFCGPVYIGTTPAEDDGVH